MRHFAFSFPLALLLLAALPAIPQDYFDISIIDTPLGEKLLISVEGELSWRLIDGQGFHNLYQPLSTTL
jgi:hypothetical protein